MNRRALKKEWKRYRKECKQNGVDFLPFDEFIEKVSSEQDQDFNQEIDSDDSFEGSNTEASLDNPEAEISDEDDFTEIDDIEEMDSSKPKGHQLTYAEAENYESYLDSLPTDVKYSELEPELWNTIIHTDTFKNAECYDIKTAEKETAEVLSNYKNLFAKPKKSTKRKKSVKKGKKTTAAAKKSTTTKTSKPVAKKTTTANKKSNLTKTLKPVAKKTTAAAKKSTTAKTSKPVAKKTTAAAKKSTTAKTSKPVAKKTTTAKKKSNSTKTSKPVAKKSKAKH